MACTLEQTFHVTFSLLYKFSEKLRRLSSACECMMKVLGASMGRSAGADDMMPALIFLLLHTNPPLFKSNLALIRRLAPPETLRRFDFIKFINFSSYFKGWMRLSLLLYLLSSIFHWAWHHRKRFEFDSTAVQPILDQWGSSSALVNGNELFKISEWTKNRWHFWRDWWRRIYVAGSWKNKKIEREKYGILHSS